MVKCGIFDQLLGGGNPGDVVVQVQDRNQRREREPHPTPPVGSSIVLFRY